MHKSYFDKCQVDTPENIVRLIWSIVEIYRKEVGVVFDAGAGDGRFSYFGNYKRYAGYELDVARISSSILPDNAELLPYDAFDAVDIGFYDLVIGNPPYVRHHDIDNGWRSRAAAWIYSRSGIRPSGMSNAYMYFLWLAVIAASDKGLITLLVPFDWVSRPAAKSFRSYLELNEWKVEVYRLDTDPFPGVLTTACVVVVDKSRKASGFSYYRISDAGDIVNVGSPTLSPFQPISYSGRADMLYANRGLSPGDQKVFLLDEQERRFYNLEPYCDVVPAVSSMRHCSNEPSVLDEEFFKTNFIEAGVRCWLINTSKNLSQNLLAYLELRKNDCATNATCSGRDVWWKYKIPRTAEILYSSGFRGGKIKILLNTVRAVHVGAVCGIYSDARVDPARVAQYISSINVGERVVALSKGFKKIEVNQMNSLLKEFLVGLGGDE